MRLKLICSLAIILVSLQTPDKLIVNITRSTKCTSDEGDKCPWVVIKSYIDTAFKYIYVTINDANETNGELLEIASYLDTKLIGVITYQDGLTAEDVGTRIDQYIAKFPNYIIGVMITNLPGCYNFDNDDTNTFQINDDIYAMVISKTASIPNRINLFQFVEGCQECARYPEVLYVYQFTETYMVGGAESRQDFCFNRSYLIFIASAESYFYFQHSFEESNIPYVYAIAQTNQISDVSPYLDSQIIYLQTNYKCYSTNCSICKGPEISDCLKCSSGLDFADSNQCISLQSQAAALLEIIGIIIIII